MRTSELIIRAVRTRIDHLNLLEHAGGSSGMVAQVRAERDEQRRLLQSLERGGLPSGEAIEDAEWEEVRPSVES